MTTASLTTDPIADLWREARSWLADAMRDFLGPAEIARALARKARMAIKRRLVLIEALVMKLLLIEAARLHPFPDARAARSPGPMTAIAASRFAPASASRLQTSAVMDPGLGAARQSGNGCAEDAADPSTWRVRFCVRVPPDPQRPAHAPPRDTGGPRIRDLGPPLLVRDIWREQARRQLIDRLRPKPDAEAAHRRNQAKAARLARRFEAVRRVLADPRRAIAALARKLAALGPGARAFARRSALAAPFRAGLIIGGAIVHACDACFDLPCDDTS
jgi:hypothetical protein